MKTIHIVPPALLVQMFGVPESVALPTAIGAETVFDAHGKRFYCKKVRRDCFHLSAPLSSPRFRWGTAKEMAEDIGHVLETGSMPQSKERMA